MRLDCDNERGCSDDRRADHKHGLASHALAGNNHRHCPLGRPSQIDDAKPQVLAYLDGCSPDIDDCDPCSDEGDHRVQSGGICRTGDRLVDPLPSEHGDRNKSGQSRETYLPSVERDHRDETPGLKSLEDLHETVRRYASQRRQRTTYLGTGLFADPAWDILLDLFVAEGRGTKISVTSACIASMVPTSTALRWVRLLETSGLITRRKDATDRRVAHLILTAEGRLGVLRWAEAVFVG